MKNGKINMIINLLPHDFNFVSDFNKRFLKNATIAELCIRFNSAPRMDVFHQYGVLKSALEILEEKGEVVSYLDPKTSDIKYLRNSEKNVILPVTKMAEPVSEAKTDADISSHVIDIGEEECDSSQKDKTLYIYRLHRRYAYLAKSAADRNLDFDLEIEDMKQLMDQTHCFYTGVKFDKNDENLKITVDRIDSKKGYVKGNVVVCTHAANQFKNTLIESKNSMFKGPSELKRFADIIYMSMNNSDDPLMDLLISHK